MICAAVQGTHTVRLGTAYVSGKHCLHAVAFGVSENVAPVQAWHARPSLENVPGGQRVHSWLVGVMALPAGHGAQIHESSHSSPSGQATHCATSATFPMGHCVQVVAPERVEILPSAQALHVSWALALEKKPGAHSVQTVAPPVEKVPGRQAEHAVLSCAVLK